jgi:diguanylate cyclase (GGDEF)-like protein
MIRSDGRRVLVEQSIGLLRDQAGHPSGYVSQFVDVTESRQARDRLRFLATHDSLTELLNRRELVARAAGILGQTPRTGENVGVLFADIDQLKPINDSLGHGIGDEVITTVAQRIRQQVRTSDVVARFGGDEFVLVLPAVHTEQDVLRIAEQIHDEVRRPMRVEGHDVSATLSIGAVMVRPGTPPEDAFRRADQALYRAKREGRDRTVLFDPRIDG